MKAINTWIENNGFTISSIEYDEINFIYTLKRYGQISILKFRRNMKSKKIITNFTKSCYVSLIFDSNKRFSVKIACNFCKGAK